MVIPDNANATPITNSVSGLIGTVEKVQVSLQGLSHSYPDDLDIALVAPGGQKIMLMSDAGGRTNVSGLTLTFDHGAAAPLADESQLASGTYQPTDYDGGDTDFFGLLSGFVTQSVNLDSLIGTNPNGNWALWVSDDAPVNTGTLDGWSLSIFTTPIVSLTNASPTTINEDTTLTFQLFVNDSDNALSSLNYRAVFDTNIIQSVSAPVRNGTNWTITVTPLPSANTGFPVPATTVISNIVTDAFGTAISANLNLAITSINDAPQVSLNTSTTSIPQGGISTNILVFVSDVDSSGTGLTTFVASSDHPEIVAPGNVFINPTSTNTPGSEVRVMQIFPTGAATGTARLTIGVTDAGLPGASPAKTNFVTIDVTVTPVAQKVFANTGAITINDFANASPYPSTINVSGVSGNVGKIEVALNGFNHASPSDVSILLVAPTNSGISTNVVLMLGAGDGTAVSNARLYFVDGAAPLPSTFPSNTQITARPTDNSGTGNFNPPAPARPYGSTLADLANLNPNGTWSLYVADSATGNIGSVTGGWVIKIFTAPTVASPGAQSTPEDTTKSVAVTVADQDGTVTNVVALSSDTSIIANPVPVSLSGSGSPKTATLTLTPLTNANGVVTITVIAQDNNGYTGTNTFALTVTPVNDRPVMSVIPKQITRAGVPILNIPLTVTDVETAASAIAVTATPDNITLLPPGSVVVGGSDSNRTISIFPAPTSKRDFAVITVVATDSQGGSTTNFFDLTVDEPANFLKNAGQQIAIIDATNANPYPSIINVRNLQGPIAEVQVALFGITEPNPDDLDIMLVGPMGTNVVLLSDAGSSTRPLTNITMLFTTAAPAQAPDEDWITNGVYLPTNYGGGDFPYAGSPADNASTLDAYVGANPNGDWKLYVRDDTALDRGGIISDWQLSIRTRPIIGSYSNLITLREDTTGSIQIPIGDNQPGVGLQVSESPVSFISSYTHTITNGILTINITPVPNAFGTNDVTVTITDTNGPGVYSVTTTFTVAVQSQDDAPVIRAISDVTTPQSTPITVPFSFYDVEGNALLNTLSVTSGDTTIIPNSSMTVTATGPDGTGTNYTGSISIMPVGIGSGDVPIAVSVRDATGLTSVQNFVVHVRRTAAFASTDVIAIPTSIGNASPFPSTIRVSGVQGAVSGVTVVLQNFWHTFPDDVDVLLVSPNGTTNVILMSDAGGSTPIPQNASIRLTFSTNGPAIPDLGPLTSGTFSPANYPGDGDFFTSVNTDLTKLNGLDPNGVWSLYVADDTFGEGGGIDGGWILLFQTGPTITLNTNTPVQTFEDTPVVVPFTVLDQDSVTTNLTVSATIDGTLAPGLLTPGSFSITTNGNDRTLTILPSTNRPSGTGMETNVVTLTVTDEVGNTASTSFQVRVIPVNDLPVVNTSTNRVLTLEDTPITINYTITDADTTLNLTNLTATSSNQDLVPNTNIVISGTFPNIAVTVTPGANRPVTATTDSTDISLLVTESTTNRVSSLVTVVVTQVNDLPAVIPGTNSITLQAEASATLPVSVNDIETSARELVLTATSDNQALIPNGNISVSGSGTDRLVTVTAANSSSGGTANITLAVADLGTGNNPPLTNFATVVVTVAAPARTYVNSTPIAIRDTNTANPFPSTIVVSNNVGGVSRVIVTLDGFAHTAPDDVDIVLRHNGKNVMVMSDAGGTNAVSNLRLRFDDTSRFILPDDSPLSSGTFRPSDYEPGDVLTNGPSGTIASTLSAFNGLDANGDWELYVVDDRARDSGQIAFGWSLQVETAPAVFDLSTSTVVMNEVPPDAPGTFSYALFDQGPLTGVNRTYTPSDPNLFPAGSITDVRSGTNVTVTLTPSKLDLDTNPTRRTNTITVTLTRPSGQSGVPDASTNFNVTVIVQPINDVPIISRLTDKTVQQDQTTNFVFLATDPDTASSSLWVTATSSNPSVISNTNIVITPFITAVSNNIVHGLPAERNNPSGLGSHEVIVTLVPNAGAVGSSQITLTLSETNSGTLTVSSNFTFTVVDRNDAPVITSLPGITNLQSGQSANISFNVSDPDPGDTITVSATSDDPTLVTASVAPATGGNGTRTLSIATAPGFTNRADVNVTIRASDAVGARTSAVITVRIRPSREVLFSNTQPIRIRDNSSADVYPSVVNVSGLVGNIRAVTVTLNGYAHSFPDDVDVLLVSPHGEKILLMSDAGGGNAITNVNVKFDQSAATDIPDASIITSGSYRPFNYEGVTSDNFPAPAPQPNTSYVATLDSVRGNSPNGDWQLFIIDDTPSDSGYVNGGWTLGVVTEPVIQNLSDVTSQEDVTARTTFTVAEEGFAGSSFTFGATSTNTTLVPNSNITISGAGTNYTVQIVPAANVSGTTLITITLTNADLQTVSGTFRATFSNVNDAPVITTAVSDLFLTSGGFVNLVNGFNYSDIETAKKDLRINVTSDNPSVLPAANVQIVGNDIRIFSSGNNVGTAQISIVVSDPEGASATNSFLVTVVPSPAPHFASTDGPIQIRNAGSTPYPSIVNVRGIVGTVQKVTVTLQGLTHPFPDDVDVLLVKRDGSRTNAVVLMSDAGGGGNTNNALSGAWLTFDDAAAGTLPDNTPIAAFTNYQPSNYEVSPTEFPAPAPAGPFGATLSTFAGMDPNGIWELYVSDDAGPDDGVLNSWSLSIQTTAPTVSFIPDLSVPEDFGTTNISFRVDVAGSPITNYVVTPSVTGDPIIAVTSNNETGNNRSITITSRTNLSGSAQVVLDITDGTNSAQSTFNVTVTPVNDVPVVLGLPSIISSSANTNLPLRLNFTVLDVETPSSNLVVTASASDSTLGTVSIQGTNENRTLVFNSSGVFPATNTVTVSVSDGTSTVLTVVEIDITAPVGPSLSGLTDVLGSEDTTVLIPFTIGGPNADTTAVLVSAGNLDLISGVTVGGTGTNRTLLVTLVPNASGASTITVIARNEFGESVKTFTLTVPNTPDAPVLGPIANVSTDEDVNPEITLDVSDVDTPISALVFSAVSSDTNLVQSVSFLNNGTNVIARLNLGANQSGAAAVSISVSDGQTTPATRTFLLTVTPHADIPTLGTIAPVTVAEDASVNVTLPVSDPDTDLANLIFAATYSNSNLVSSVSFTTEGTNKVAHITLVTNAIGTANITIAVSDDVGTAVSSFVLTVNNTDNDAPVIASVPDQSTGENIPLVVNLTVADPDNALSELSFSAAPEGSALVSGVRFDITGSNTVALTLTPLTDVQGTDRITVSVSDGENVTRTMFNMTVTNVNESPVLGAIADQTTVEDVFVTIPLTISDRETATSNLTVTATSSNTNLVSAIVINRTGDNISATIQTRTNAFGASDITVNVGDGTSTTSRTFHLTVIEITEPPTLGAIADRTVGTNTITVLVPLTVSDPDNRVEDLTFLGSAATTNIVSGISFTKTSSNAVATITLVPGASGTDRVTIRVSDGSSTATQMFNLTVSGGGTGSAAQLSTAIVGNNLSITVTGTAGTTYAIQAATEVSGPYQQIGTVTIGSSGSESVQVPLSGAHRFFRAVAQ